MEISAVVNQIQGTMTPEQLGSIAALRLTEDSLDDLSFGLNQNEVGGFGGFGGFIEGAPPDIGGNAPSGGTYSLHRREVGHRPAVGAATLWAVTFTRRS